MSEDRSDKFSKKGKGIVDGLNEEVKESDKKEKEKKEQKKIKRTFMLTEDAVDMIYHIKSKNRNKTLSDIVSEAILEYGEKFEE